MGAAVVGQPSRASFSAGVSVVAADDPERPELRRSPPALSHYPDPVHVVSRHTNRRESVRDSFRQPGSFFVLLAGRALRSSLPAGLVACYSWAAGGPFVSQ